MTMRYIDLSKEPEEPVYGVDWGTEWRYHESTNELEHILEGYRVDLDRMQDSAQVLDWIFQVAKKPWCDPEGLADLIYCIEVLVKPQELICSGAIARDKGILNIILKRHGSDRKDP